MDSFKPAVIRLWWLLPCHVADEGLVLGMGEMQDQICRGSREEGRLAPLSGVG